MITMQDTEAVEMTNEEIFAETEDRPTLKAVNELTAEDVAIKEYLKAVYKTKSKHEVEQLSRQLWNKARASLPSKSRDEAIAEFIQELGSHGISIDLNKLKEFQEAAINLFEAGRQSSLAEIIGLKEQLDLKDERIEELKQQLADLKIKITHLESTLQFERGEMQERVRKLKESIENMYHKLGKTNVWRAGNDEVCDICEDYFKREIDEIFTDCAEHTNELNADFRKFAKKTLRGEKDKG